MGVKTPEVEHRPNIELIDGLYMIRDFYTLEKLRAVKGLNLEAGDVIVSTYPKCGTTWVQYIIWEILNDGKNPPPVHEIMTLYPFLELNGVEILQERQHPWCMKVHLPFSYVPQHPEAKYIYVARNPKDCCTSYYAFLKQFPTVLPTDTPFEEFFECFIDGYMPWGDCLDHILTWHEHRHDPNVLFLTYEEMKKDPGEAIMQIAKFLNEEHYRKLSEDQETFQRILQLTSFDHMKTLQYLFPMDPDWMKAHGSAPSREEYEAHPDKYMQVDFFRKGEVGDWKNFFTEDMRRRYDDVMERKLKGTDLFQLWKEN